MSQSTANLQAKHQPASSTMPAWKAELNAKLEAHRRRRDPAEALNVTPRMREVANGPEAGTNRAIAARVAARVAERYAHAPTYSEVLAARAAAASAAAGAAAAAAQQAHAAAEVLLSSLAERPWESEEPRVRGAEGEPIDLLAGEPSWKTAQVKVPQGGAARVEHPEPLPERGLAPPRINVGASATLSIVDAFAEAEVPAAMSLPAKLIEFPRELVAMQRARPRLAEGPLVEEEEAGLLPLRIFEVDGENGQHARPALKSEAAAPEVQSRAGAPLRDPQSEEGEEQRAYGGEGRAGNVREAGVPAWQSIRLGEHPSAADELTFRQRGPSGAVEAAPLLLPAPLASRAMAALVDLGLVAGGFLLFVLTFAACTIHPPAWRVAAPCCGIVFAALGIFYQWLFMNYGGGTPGMRYARVALCTFDDNNPTRAMLRSRVWAGVLVALPLGLGFLWALFDEDSLGWHDRLTGTYQRSY